MINALNLLPYILRYVGKSELASGVAHGGSQNSTCGSIQGFCAPKATHAESGRGFGDIHIVNRRNVQFLLFIANGALEEEEEEERGVWATDF